jgi:molecular chaperone HscC
MTFGLDVESQHLGAAWIGPGGSPQLIADKHDPDLFTTPSVVGLDGSRAYVGRSAEVFAEDNPLAAVAQDLNSSLGTGEELLRDARGRGWFAETLLTPLLAKVLDDAAIAAGTRPTHAVVSVPCEFSPPQRQAVLRAADWAGIASAVLLNRSLAAARFLASGLASGGNDLALVFAVGSRFADVTLIEIGPRSLAVRGVASGELGSRALDEALWQALRPVLGEAVDDPTVQAKVLPGVRAWRKKFQRTGTRDAETVLFVQGKPHVLNLTALQHEQICAPLAAQSLELAQAALRQAGITWDRITHLWPIGTGAQEPTVLAALAAEAGRSFTPRMALQAPAFGAALHAADLHGGQPWLGLPTRPGRPDSAVALRLVDADRKPTYDTLIASGSPLPARATRQFTTARADQVRMVFDLVFINDSAPESAGLFAFGPIAKPRPGLVVELLVTLGPDGVLAAEATEGVGGPRLRRTLLARGGSSEPLVAQRNLLEGIRHA